MKKSQEEIRKYLNKLVSDILKYGGADADIETQRFLRLPSGLRARKRCESDIHKTTLMGKPINHLCTCKGTGYLTRSVSLKELIEIAPLLIREIQHVRKRKDEGLPYIPILPTLSDGYKVYYDNPNQQ